MDDLTYDELRQQVRDCVVQHIFNNVANRSVDPLVDAIMAEYVVDNDGTPEITVDDNALTNDEFISQLATSFNTFKDAFPRFDAQVNVNDYTRDGGNYVIETVMINNNNVLELGPFAQGIVESVTLDSAEEMRAAVEEISANPYPETAAWRLIQQAQYFAIDGEDGVTLPVQEKRIFDNIARSIAVAYTLETEEPFLDLDDPELLQARIDLALHELIDAAGLAGDEEALEEYLTETLGLEGDELNSVTEFFLTHGENLTYANLFSTQENRNNIPRLDWNNFEFNPVTYFFTASINAQDVTAIEEELGRDAEASIGGFEVAHANIDGVTVQARNGEEPVAEIDLSKLGVTF